MKKKYLFIILFCILLFIIFILFKSKSYYSISVSKIDDYSPDRKLVVYKDDKVIDYEKILYLDGMYLCSSSNPTVSTSDLVNEEELIVVLNNNKEVKAKIVKK